MTYSCHSKRPSLLKEATNRLFFFCAGRARARMTGIRHFVQIQQFFPQNFVHFTD
jgi:hypothetical protein